MQLSSPANVLLLIGLAWLVVTPARAEVTISEIMYNPAGVDFDPAAPVPFNREWVELYNNGTAPRNLSGWRLGDWQKNTYADPIPAGTILQPKQALVITGDATAFDAQWGHGINRVQVNNFVPLDNAPPATGQTVVIRDAAGNIQDRVTYQQAAGWPRTNNDQGQSIFALPSGLDGGADNLARNWAPSMWGAYSARFSPVQGENHASPGIVAAVPQTAFVPSPDVAWSMVVLPDTQNYVASAVDRQIFTQQTEWIRDHRDAYHIQAVLHEGDIVNDFPSISQWQNAQRSMSVLDGKVPYIMAAGNHDYDNRNWPARITKIDDYFQPSRNPLVDPARGGILKGTMSPGKIENAYYAFTAPDGRKMLVLALEYEPRPETIAWANEIAGRPEYADYTAVLLTHAYFFNNNLRYTRAALDCSGEQLWQQLVKGHANFELTFNGHFGGDGAGYLASTADHGNVVHQMLLDAQHETYGGDGWLRLVEFLKDGSTVRVRTYSPLFDMYHTGPDFQYDFRISPLPRRIGRVAPLPVPEPSAAFAALALEPYHVASPHPSNTASVDSRRALVICAFLV